MRKLIVSIKGLVLCSCMLAALTGCGETDLDHYNKGVNLMGQPGQTELAEQQFKLALQKNPELAEAYLNLGAIYLRQGLLEGAESNTGKAISILERTKRTYVEGSTWNQTASIAYLNLGLIEINKALAAELKSDKDLARNHMLMALAPFKRAVDLDPGNLKAKANLERFKEIYQKD